MLKNTRKVWIFVLCLTCLIALAACQPSQGNVGNSEPKTTELAQSGGSDFESMGYSNFFNEDSGAYPDNFYSTTWINSANRGCNACHEDLFDLADSVHPEIVHLATSDPGYGKNATWNDCYTCHNGYVLGGVNLNDTIHNVHYGSPIFVQELGGNCYTCHAVNNNGDMILYDFYRYSSDFGSFMNAGDPGIVDWTHGRAFENDSPSGATIDNGMDITMTSFVNEVTPQEDCFVALNYGLWEIDANEWTLDVKGVKNERSFTLEELQAMPQIERTMVVSCSMNAIGSYQLGNAPFKGVALETLIDACGGLVDGNISVSCRGQDGWMFPFEGGYDVQMLIDNGCMIALEKYGKPLTAYDGFPAVFVMPGQSAFAWSKYAKTITFSDEPGITDPNHETAIFLGPYEETYTNYADPTLSDFPQWGHVTVNSGFWTPINDGDVLKMENGKVGLKGFAHTIAYGGYQLDKIKFSADYGNTWTEFDIPSNLDPVQLITWEAEWTPEKPGTYVLYVAVHEPSLGWQQFPAAITVVVE